MSPGMVKKCCSVLAVTGDGGADHRGRQSVSPYTNPKFQSEMLVKSLLML